MVERLIESLHVPCSAILTAFRIGNRSSKHRFLPKDELESYSGLIHLSMKAFRGMRSMLRCENGE